MAVASVDEPWFALSKGTYQSILNEALSEMEVGLHESDMELSNCTELIKLLNQDDGLGPGNGVGSSLLVSPPEASKSGLGVTPVKSLQNHCSNAKEGPRHPADTGPNMAMGRIGSQMLGRGKRKRLACKRILFDPLCESSRGCFEGNRTRPRCAKEKVSETFGKKTLEVPTRVNTTTRGHNLSDQIRNELLRRRETQSRNNSTPVTPNNSQCSRRLPKTFSLYSGRRPSAVLDDRRFQGHRLLGHSLNEGLPVSDGAVIPNPVLSLVDIVKVERGWRPSCSNSLPYTTFASRSLGVKVELEDTVSGRELEHADLRRNSETDWKKEDSAHSPDQGGRVNLSAGATPRPEAIDPVHSGLSGTRYTAREFNLEAGGLRSKLIYRQQRSVVGNGLEHASSSWSNRRNSAANMKHGNTGSRAIIREVRPTSSGSGRVYGDFGKKVTSLDSSQYELSFFGTSHEAWERNREDAKTWKDRSELWVAVDKLMVRSMMHQILSEESSEEALNFQPQQQRLKDEVGLTELHTEVDPILPVEPSEDFRLSVPDRVSNLQLLTHAEKPSDQRLGHGLDGAQRCVNIELSKSDPNQDAAYDLRTKLSAGDKIANVSESFCAGNTRDPVKRTKNDSSTETVPVSPSLFGETGSGVTLPRADVAVFNAQKIGLSRMSFKWKSNILYRLRKDQITANNWRLSETLSV